MGSITSGNHGGRPAVEDGLTLNLAKLLRDRLLRPGYGSLASPSNNDRSHNDERQTDHTP
jgi:hypothetical protein